MPHPIIEIDELLRLILAELVETSPRTTVSLALTCRSLEEPTLRPLWRQQKSLYHLLRVLPNRCIRVGDGNSFGVIVIEHDPSVEEWARLLRYASWMRRLYLDRDEWHTSDTLSRLSSNSPGGLLFPNLEWLHWDVYESDTALAYFRLFLSPHLQRVTLYADLDLFDYIPRSQLAAIIRVISFLPTSLEYLSVMYDSYWEENPLKDAVSSFICRCGPSLRGFGTFIPLSEAAIHRLTQLPNLSHWTTAQEPPQAVPTSIFPSLEHLHLNSNDALTWLHLPVTLRNSPAPATSLTNVGGALKTLDCCWSATLGSNFLSTIAEFQNLVTLRVRTYDCSNGGGYCTFHLTDDDMEHLAAALPRLKHLRLREPCQANTCNTTVASLVSLSANCLDLTLLETHFNTLTIADDMRRLLDRGAGCDQTKCKLRSILVGNMPLEVRKEDIETIAMGFKVIFPCLTDIRGSGGHWQQLIFT